MATTPDLDRVCDVVKRIGEIDAIEPDQDFYQAGVNSLKAMDVMLDLESEFGVAVPDDQFVKARTPSALLDLVRSLQTA